MQSSRSPFCWVYPKAHASSTSIIKRFIHDIYICIWWYSSNIDVCLFSSNIYNSKLFLHAHSVGRPLFGHRRWSLLHFCWPNPRWHRRPMDFVDCRCFWTEAPKVSKLIWSVHEYLQHRWQNRLRWSCNACRQVMDVISNLRLQDWFIVVTLSQALEIADIPRFGGS